MGVARFFHFLIVFLLVFFNSFDVFAGGGGSSSSTSTPVVEPVQVAPVATMRIETYRIHGYTGEDSGGKYFGDMDNQVRFNSKVNVNEAAESLGESLKAAMIQDNCYDSSTCKAILRSHSYGGQVTVRVLQKFSSIRNSVLDHVSLQGAHNGTALIDPVCGMNDILGVDVVGFFAGKPCVRSLDSTTQNKARHYNIDPQVITYMTYSSEACVGTNSLVECAGSAIINKSQLGHLSFWSRIWNNNQNDGVLPTNATRGCSSTRGLTGDSEDCGKIHSKFKNLSNASAGSNISNSRMYGEAHLTFLGNSTIVNTSY